MSIRRLSERLVGRATGCTLSEDSTARWSDVHLSKPMSTFGPIGLADELGIAGLNAVGRVDVVDSIADPARDEVGIVVGEARIGDRVGMRVAEHVVHPDVEEVSR